MSEARSFSSDQQKDLEGDVGRLAAFAHARGAGVSIRSGSDHDGRRPKILKLLVDPAVPTIVVEENMVEVFTSLLARLYGRRWTRSRTNKALAALEAK